MNRAGQGTLQPVYSGQLQGFDSTGIFQDIEQHLDFPTRPVPIDQFIDFLERTGMAIRQQAPFNWFGPCWRTQFPRHDAGNGDGIAFASGQFHTLGP